MAHSARQRRCRVGEIELPEGAATGLTAADIRVSFLDHLFYGLGRTPMSATRNDLYTALALAVRDMVLKHGAKTLETYCEQEDRKSVV